MAPSSLVAFAVLSVVTLLVSQQPRLCSASVWVEPCFDAACRHWNDTDGNRIEAHAAGMLTSPQDNRWYWFGESKKTSNLSTHGVTCYSSLELGGPWKYEGMVFKQSDVNVPGQSGPWVIERPKVLYNPSTKKFVMWFHLDTAGYQFRHAAVAVADHAAGPYEWVHAFQPDGIPSLDMSLFEDPLDNEAYFVRSCNNQFAGISRLTSDYMNTTGLISKHDKFEGMALMRLQNGTYYIVTSHLTGWNPNPLMMFRAAGKTLDDPQWVSLGNPTGDPTSFNSQPTFVVSLTANNSEYFVYMADNWVHGGPDGLIDAAYIWLPFFFEKDTVQLKKLDRWNMDDPFAPPPPPPPCHPKDARLALRPCAIDAAAMQTWTMDVTGATSQVQLAYAPSFCMTSVVTTAQVSVEPCTRDPATQGWQFQNSRITLGKTQDCLDVTWCGQTVCPGMFLSTYHCHADSQHNELFDVHAGNTTIVSHVNGQCLTAVCDHVT